MGVSSIVSGCLQTLTYVIASTTQNSHLEGCCFIVTFTAMKFEIVCSSFFIYPKYTFARKDNDVKIIPRQERLSEEMSLVEIIVLAHVDTERESEKHLS